MRATMHMATAPEIRRVFGTGEKITALCGRRFAPKREGDWRHRICRKCRKEAGDSTLRPFRVNQTPSVTWTYTFQWSSATPTSGLPPAA